MGVLDSLNLGGVGNFIAGYGFIAKFILLIFVGIIVFGVIGFFIYYKVANKKKFTKTVNLFKFVNGKRFFIESDKARELVIAGTNVRLLKWKNKNIYSAYPTRAMGNNIYAYNINRFGELTNFDFGEGDDQTEATMDFDHRDQTYAYLNLQALINKNYRDKNTLGWWKENLPLITIIIAAVLLGLEMWFFFSQSSQQLVTWGNIAQEFSNAAETMAQAVGQSQNLNSGIVPVA